MKPADDFSMMEQLSQSRLDACESSIQSEMVPVLRLVHLVLSKLLSQAPSHSLGPRLS